MSTSENKILQRRLDNAYLSTVISISLVLLLVGVAALLMVNAGSVSKYFKENLQISVMMLPEVSDEVAMDFQAELEDYGFVRSTRFVSKEQGTQEMKEILGDDFLSVFETSPIPASIEVSLNAEYVVSDSLEVVKKQLQESSLVDEVDYQQSLVDALNANLKKISLILGIAITLLLFISFVLINNTVRLSVFSRRFTIHTMKLVGATRSFIRSPFMLQALFQGLFAAILAIIFLIAGLFVIKGEFAMLFEVFQLKLLVLVIGIVIVCGVAICMLSTFFVVNKLVSLSKDELYY